MSHIGYINVNNNVSVLCHASTRVISRNLKLGGYGQMFGGRKQAGSANLHYKTLKNKKVTNNRGGGVSSRHPPIWGWGVKISLASTNVNNSVLCSVDH